MLYRIACRGFSEIVTLRVPATNACYRTVSSIVGAVFLARFIIQLVPIGYVPGNPYIIWISIALNSKDMDFLLVYIDIYTSFFVPYTVTAFCAGKNPIDSLYCRAITYNNKKLDNLVKELTK
jgi:hypothetical protein